MSKQEEKQKAIKLRKQGYSYSEILKQVSVAKSTLSLWLRSVGLSKKQKQRLTKKKLESALRGAKKKREQRIALINKIYQEAEKDIKKITNKELWLMGIMLYWAEGSKEKEYHPGSGIKFTNSDYLMIKLFLRWLVEILEIDRERIVFEIYIHANYKYKLNKVINFWSKQLLFPKRYFSKIYFKKDKINTRRKNTGKSYYGIITVRIKESSGLHRKIDGWIRGVINHSGVV